MVRTGSNKNLICLRVSQSPTKDCIIVWDLEKDLEKLSFDVESRVRPMPFSFKKKLVILL